MGRVCDCESWKQGREFLAVCNRMFGNRGYAALPVREVWCSKPFVYCPWCGKELVDERPPDSE